MTSARTSLLYVGGAIVQGMAVALVVPFATRILGVEEYGVAATGLAIIQVTVVVASAGLPLAITREYFEPGTGPWRARVVVGLVVALAAVVSLAGLALLALRPGDGGLVGLALALTASGPLGAVAAVQAYLRAEMRPGWFVGLGIASSAVAHGVALAAATVRPSATVYLGAFAAMATVVAVAGLVVVRPALPRRRTGVVGDAVRIGLPVLPHSLALLLLTTGPVLLLAVASGETDAGRYQALLLFVQGPLVLLNALNNVWVPTVLSGGQGKEAAVLRGLTPTIMTVGAAIAVSGALAASAVTPVLVDASFGREELVGAARFLPLVGVGHALYLAASIPLFVVRRTGALAIVTPGTALVGAAVAWTYAASGDLRGLAICQAGAFLLLGVATAVASRRAQHSWFSGKLLVVLVVPVVVALLVALTPTTPAWSVVEFLLAGAVVATGSFLLFRTRDPERRASLEGGKSG